MHQPKEGGEPLQITDTFFWLCATLRNPYNGVLGTDMWVSYMTLNNFPGKNHMRKYKLTMPRLSYSAFSLECLATPSSSPVGDGKEAGGGARLFRNYETVVSCMLWGRLSGSVRSARRPAFGALHKKQPSSH